MVLTNQGFWDWQGVCQRGRDEKYRHSSRKFKLFLVQVNPVLFLPDSRWYLCHLLLDLPYGLFSSGFYPKNALYFSALFSVCAIFLAHLIFFIILILDEQYEWLSFFIFLQFSLAPFFSGLHFDLHLAVCNWWM